MSMWQKIQQSLRNASGEAGDRERITIGPASRVVVRPGDATMIAPATAVRVAPDRKITVTPPPRGLWDERGWTCEGQNGRKFYQGFYHVRDRRRKQTLSWPGRVLVEGRDEVTPYIADPPANLSRHPKWACFTNEGGRWFRLHWHRRAGNVDDAISYMEKILDEVVN